VRGISAQPDKGCFSALPKTHCTLFSVVPKCQKWQEFQYFIFFSFQIIVISPKLTAHAVKTLWDLKVALLGFISVKTKAKSRQNTGRAPQPESYQPFVGSVWWQQPRLWVLLGMPGEPQRWQRLCSFNSATLLFVGHIYRALNDGLYANGF
jgi:hypothetical protein